MSTRTPGSDGGPEDAERTALDGLVTLSDASEIRVLLVDDDPQDALRLRGLLEDAGEGAFRVGQARGVEQALAMLQSGKYDVMLLDLTLPEGDGLDVLVRAKVAALATPIIAMAAEDDEQQSVKAVRLGAQDCLTKHGVTAARLARALRHAVERHRLLAEVQLARHREHYVATHDALTGLPNRFQLDEFLGRALSHADRTYRSIAVLFLDLDRFKTINDSLGHRAGDEVLRQVVERVCPLIRRSDMMARLGGDEFLIVLQDVHHAYGPATLAKQILQRLLEPFLLSAGKHWVGVSIGIAAHPRDGRDAEELVRNADTAMYQAKAGGGGTFRFYKESMNTTVARRLTIESGLRSALASGGLRLHYQPRVNVSLNRVVGVEALLRWTSPELGIVNPGEIVAVAEEAGIIAELGRWTLSTATRQIRQWDRAGLPPLCVSVNTSAHELQPDVLLPAVELALRESGLPSRRLEIEITETAFMRDERAGADVLRELRAMGVRVSLDDFGTGYSSLSLLRRLRVDTLKIDRSFIQGIETDKEGAAIVSAILAMADRLKIGVVAEGVEIAQQREILISLGCHEMQGYLFGKPLSSDAFVHAVKSRVRRQRKIPAHREGADCVQELREHLDAILDELGEPKSEE